MRRRTLLALLPTALAGCGAGSGDPDPTTATNDDVARSPTPTTVEETERSTRAGRSLVREYAPDLATPPPGECSASRPTGPWDDEFEPADYPDPPDEWTTEAIEGYIEAFERSHLHRLELEEGGHDLSGASLDVEADTIADDGETYVLEVDASGRLVPERVERDPPPSPTPATVTPTVTQLPTEVVGYASEYVVTRRFAARSGGPDEEWTVVACFDRP